MIIALVPLLVQAALLQDVLTPATLRYESPWALFGLVVIAASLCVVTSAMVLVRAVFTATPELVPTGLFFMAVSVMGVVHGLTTPGVLFGDNTATMASALWAIPLGLAVASPLLLPRSLQHKLLPRHATPLLVAGLVIIVGVAAVSLARPQMFPAYQPGGSVERLLATFSILGVLGISFRQVRLAQIARNRGPLVIAAGYTFVASSAVLWFHAEMFSLGFWAAHIFDIAGVFAGTIGILVIYRKTDAVRNALEPVLLVDPLAALELGLEPEVHRYIADLEAKDPITRDHVIRTSELALLVGEEMGYRGDKLRHISLVGLLHDVGKLDIPDEIINKPGKLSDEEFAIIKDHPVSGANRALESLVLAPLAPGIRGHHERIDGGGYPDAKQGDQIPIESRIVAVCDSYDAMANTRQYRSGMGRDKAVAILREHQGSQWDATAVDALVRVVSRQTKQQPSAVLDNVGRVGCDCLPASLVEPELV